MNLGLKEINNDHNCSTPLPPYYAVIFTSIRTDNDNGYAETAEKIHHLATKQPGYLGMESEVGITVSYSISRVEECILDVWK